MPTKTAARQKKVDTKTTKVSGDGSKNGSTNKTASKNQAELETHVTDVVDLSEAKAEYDKRRKSQLAAIKKLDKELLRTMLYEMVLGRVFEQSVRKLSHR